MAFGPITSWQIEGGKVEVVTNFLFLVSKITVDGDCSYEIRRRLLLGRKAMTKNLDSGLKNRDITLPTKVCIVKAMVFPVVMYGCESWTVKKAECQRSGPLNCGAGEDSWNSPGQQGDQTSQSLGRSTLNIHWKDWCCSWSSSIMVIWCEQMTLWKSPWSWERLRAEGEEDFKGWDGWTPSPMQWIWTWAILGRCWGTGRPAVLQSMGSKRVRHDWVTGWLDNNHLSLSLSTHTYTHTHTHYLDEMVG